MVPTKQMNPHVPISPDEIIEQVHEAFEAGITLAHLHARDAEGVGTYHVSIYDKILTGVRRHCPGLVICCSLSGRNFNVLEKRTEVLQLRPDMGSLTLSSLNFSKQASVNSPEMIEGLARKMDEYGVIPELECFDSGMVNYAHFMIRKGWLRPPYYFNLLFGNIANTQADMAYVGLILKDLPAGSYWSLAGLGDDQLKMNALAVAFGGGVRVGLEDNIWYDAAKTRLGTNLDLLKRVLHLSEIFEREVMAPREFGALGFYNKLQQPSGLATV
jgi:3-keto-5-aminohexanoate cleavage enzyme